MELQILQMFADLLWLCKSVCLLLSLLRNGCNYRERTRISKECSKISSSTLNMVAIIKDF